jgi:hypothetical protein
MVAWKNVEVGSELYFCSRLPDKASQPISGEIAGETLSQASDLLWFIIRLLLIIHCGLLSVYY